MKCQIKKYGPGRGVKLAVKLDIIKQVILPVDFDQFTTILFQTSAPPLARGVEASNRTATSVMSSRTEFFGVVILNLK